MAEITKKLHYRRGGITYDISLYNSTADVGADYISLRVDQQTVYAKLGAVTEMEATHLRVRKGNVTYAVMKSDMIELPVGFIGMFTGACPTGWELESDFVNKYVKGAANGANGGAVGGSAYHSHTVPVGAVWSGYTSSPTKGGNNNVNIGGYYPNYDNHRHYFTAQTFSTESTDLVQPPYHNVIYCRKL